MKDTIKGLIKHEVDAICNIPIEDSIENAVLLIQNSVHNNSGKVITTGMGKAGQIALNIATTLSSTGTPSAFIHPSDAQHGDLGLIQENDVIILLSNSGKTREILEFVELAKVLHPKIKFVAVVGNPESPLGEVADVTISTGNPKEVCPLALSPTTSTTVMTVIGDVLVVLMMEKIGFTAEDYAKRHHGGYLGNKSREMIK